MKKARDVIGLPILCVQTGKELGHAKDVRLSEHWQVEALLLEAGHWFQDATGVEWNEVVALGEDAITVKREEAVVTLKESPESRFLLSGERKVKGLPVMTVNGQQLGLVEDVYLDSKVGRNVIGYELTEGFISDLKEGRKWLPMPDSIKIGEDALIVPVHASEALEEIFVPKEE